MKLEISVWKKEKSQKITEKIKSFEDACELLQIKGDIITGSLNDSLEGDSKAIIAHLKLLVIAKALNEGWTPDWINSNQYKYYPWFDLSSGFLFDSVDYDFTHTGVGSRLCFKSRELAEYAGTQFLDLYKDYLK